MPLWNIKYERFIIYVYERYIMKYERFKQKENEYLEKF